MATCSSRLGGQQPFLDPLDSKASRQQGCRHALQLRWQRRSYAEGGGPSSTNVKQLRSGFKTLGIEGVFWQDGSKDSAAAYDILPRVRPGNRIANRGRRQAMNVNRMLPDESPRRPQDFHPGDRVRVIDGTFKGMEGEVGESLRSFQYGFVVVILPLFDRPTPVELEPWQIQHGASGPA